MKIKCFIPSFILGVLLVITFCQKKEMIDLKYDYEIHDETYRIESLTNAFQARSYILYKINTDENEMLAKDINADGEIDSLFTQTVTSDSIARIYQMGIWMNSDFKISENHVYSKIFKHENALNTFSLQTIIPVNGKIVNRFIIHAKDNSKKTIALDINADGQIEEVVNERTVSNEIQNYYSNSIKEGLLQDAIVKNYNMVFIKTCMNERK